MKVMLIGINAKYIHPCLALYQLQANCDYPVRVKEFTIKEKVADIFQFIINEQPAVLGFSCYIWNITHVVQLIKMLKTNYSPIIFLGGPEVAYDATYYLHSLPIDYVISSEGETVLPALIAFLRGNITVDNVPSLSYKSKGQVVHNQIRLPDLAMVKQAVFQVPDYLNRVVYLEASRGCPFNCSYCCASIEKGVRFFPLPVVLETLKRLMREKARTVKFLDRTFNANPTYLKSILTCIKEQNDSTIFQFEIVADHLTTDVIELIKSFPKKWLRFEIGIQSIHEHVNASVNRKQDLTRLRHNILALQALNLVDLHLDLIAGLPYETKDLFIQSFNEVFSYRPKELQLGFLKLLRGTALKENIQKYNYQYQVEPPYEVITNHFITAEELNEIRGVALVLDKYYNSLRFTKTFTALYAEQRVHSFYHFFLELSLYIKAKNFSFIGYLLHDIYLLLAGFLEINYSFCYRTLRFALLQDYLIQAKTKPKRWWTDLSKQEKLALYPKIVQENPQLTLELLYRCSVTISEPPFVFVIVYQDFNPKYYLFENII